MPALAKIAAVDKPPIPLPITMASKLSGTFSRLKPAEIIYCIHQEHKAYSRRGCDKRRPMQLQIRWSTSSIYLLYDKNSKNNNATRWFYTASEKFSKSILERKWEDQEWDAGTHERNMWLRLSVKMGIVSKFARSDMQGRERLGQPGV